ncbi:MAG: hypothetical protein ACK5TH_14340 [Prosthecobacter sp.]|jgi:hypothetical protein
MTDYHDVQREWSERRLHAETMLSSLSQKNRARFCEEALLHLLDAGWNDERVWNATDLNEHARCFETACPDCVHEVFRSFGGLSIGFEGRHVSVGQLAEYDCPVPVLLGHIAGGRLYAIGETDMLSDEVLGILMDEKGCVYLDGSTSDSPPKDRCLGKVACDFTDFLNAVFSDDVGVLEQTSWIHYSAHQRSS